ncbi:IS110 family transposase [Nocardia vinacea]|uniref:IS110 family transposase n=1 Tax=Nocardia vinacea TaxID=96468 RepID=UPI0002D751C3|nr:transposase [Nocardia vinacea]
MAVDATGKQAGKSLTVKNDALLITALLKWIRAIAGDAPVTWAIEDGHGFARRLADGLLLAGHEVVWVPTRLTAAHRKLHAATGSKSDLVDAMAAAHAAIATPGLDRHRIDNRVRELRMLVDYRSDVIKRRTMAINQLKAHLHVWINHTPGDLARTKVLASLTGLLDSAQLGDHVHRVITDMIAEVADFNRRVRELDTSIKDLVGPLAPELLKIVGISHISAAVCIDDEVGRTNTGSPERSPVRSTAAGRSCIPRTPSGGSGPKWSESGTNTSHHASTLLLRESLNSLNHHGSTHAGTPEPLPPPRRPEPARVALRPALRARPRTQLASFAHRP